LTVVHTVIRFVSVSAKFGTYTVVSVSGTLVESKMCTFTLESTHFFFNKCPIYINDGATAQFSTNSHETDYSAVPERKWRKYSKGKEKGDLATKVLNYIMYNSVVSLINTLL
jgi:hypothetical protein